LFASTLVPYGSDASKDPPGMRATRRWYIAKSTNSPSRTERTSFRSATRTRSAFLTAEWRHLAMLNYAVDPEILAAHVPAGTTLDTWNGVHYLSVVAFRFLDTRIHGVPIPFHRNFDEINLRFYVGREGHEGWRRGVVFIKEVVPRKAIAAVARWVYNENYLACPTRSFITLPADDNGLVSYSWRPRGMPELAVEVSISGSSKVTAPGSQEEFITEHYWGYAAQRDGGTIEYRVEHPPWEVWPGHTAKLIGPVGQFYGRDFGEALSTAPVSAFVARGSPVIVRKGHRL